MPNSVDARPRAQRLSPREEAHHRRITSQGPLPPLVTRAELVVSDAVNDALGAVKQAHGEASREAAARAFVSEVEEGRASYGTMLARVWKEAQRTITEVERDDAMPVAKRVAALRDLTRLMPTLAKAEAAHTARIGGKKIEDMTDAQLEKEWLRIRRQRKTRRVTRKPAGQGGAGREDAGGEDT